MGGASQRCVVYPLNDFALSRFKIWQIHPGDTGVPMTGNMRTRREIVIRKVCLVLYKHVKAAGERIHTFRPRGAVGLKYA